MTGKTPRQLFNQRRRQRNIDMKLFSDYMVSGMIAEARLSLDKISDRYVMKIYGLTTDGTK